jgi:hypothetical protein
MVTLSLFATAIDSRVDAENGILRGVRVITKGEVATHSFLGEPLIVDDQTIAEIVAAAATFPDGVPVKLAHGTDIEELIGAVKDIVADGDCARGDMYLLKSHESYATIIEMAETMPSNFGISISFQNAPEGIKGNDMEPDGDEDDEENVTAGINPQYQDDIVAYACRVAELYSCDLVANPSANPSLFQTMSEPATTEAPAVAVEEIPTEAPIVDETIAGEIKHIAEVVASEAAPEEIKEELEVHGPEGTQNLPEEVKGDPKVEQSPEVPVTKDEIPAPAELSRSWKGVVTDLESTRTELSRVTTELSAARAEIEGFKSELSKRDSELTDLRYLHRSVLSVMGLSASIEVPEIVEEAAALSVIEQYESMSAGPERLSFFQANRREIERSIAARLK